MDDLEIVRVLKALGDEMRFRMVQEIAAAGELTCGSLVETCGLSQPTVSHHLKILVDAGVLVVREEGRHHYLSVNHARVGSLRTDVASRLSPAARHAGRKGEKK